MSRLLFQWKHAKTAKQIRAGIMPKLVRVPKDLKALDVRLKQPPRSTYVATEYEASADNVC